MTKDRDIRYHFLALLETHDPDRAAILTSIVFKIEKDKVLKICKEDIEKDKPITLKE